MKPIYACGLAFTFALLLAGVAAPAPVPVAKDTPETELARLVGKWTITSRVQGGVETITDKEEARESIVAFNKEGVFGWDGGAEEMGKIARIDPSKNPKEIDYLFTTGTYKGKTQKGLYKFENDTFIDCCTEPGQERPTEFKSTKENGYEIMTAKRVKKVD